MRSNRDAIGACDHIVTGAGEQRNQVATAAVHFGPGRDKEVKQIVFTRPSGTLQRYRTRRSTNTSASESHKKRQ